MENYEIEGMADQSWSELCIEEKVSHLAIGEILGNHGIEPYDIQTFAEEASPLDRAAMMQLIQKYSHCQEEHEQNWEEN